MSKLQIIGQSVICTKSNIDIRQPVTCPDESRDWQSAVSSYPNPFSQTTTIAYILKEESVIRLVVYDLIGQEITVVDEGMRTAGVHKISFDRKSLAPGIYFYTLTTKRDRRRRRWWWNRSQHQIGELDSNPFKTAENAKKAQ
jgi:hypothetical protein